MSMMEQMEFRRGYGDQDGGEMLPEEPLEMPDIDENEGLDDDADYISAFVSKDSVFKTRKEVPGLD